MDGVGALGKGAAPACSIFQIKSFQINAIVCMADARTSLGSTTYVNALNLP